jgi:hypothetical protein
MVLTLDSGKRKARKPHKCSMCYRVIDPGEVYEWQSNIHDNHLYTWKECAHCQAMQSIIDFAYWAGYPDEGIGPFDVGEYEPETIAEARLIVGWRTKWRRKDGTLREVPQ